MTKLSRTAGNEDRNALPLTVSIRDVGAESLALVGGKGANLGELLRANLPVPAAYCVTTRAYDAFVRSNGLSAFVESELATLNYDDVADLGVRATRVRERFAAGSVSLDIDAAIRAGYGELEGRLGKGVKVSVRSSATAEDLPGTSFAGQQDTYLNVSGADSVVEHVKRCWASLWTDRAISYRHRQGFRHQDVLLAVVVQEMFPSDVAGVMFTVNPLTSNPNEIFINTSWGLGEAIVSGRVNPDQYIVDKKTGAISSRVINAKAVMTVPGPGGVGSEEIEVSAGRQTAETLSPAQIAELAKIGSRIEAYYGFPQDIEWGFSNGRFALLQSREVTALDIDFAYELEAFQSPVAREALTDERWVWSRGYSDEFQTGPSTPWFYSLIESGMTKLKHSMLAFTEVKQLLGFDAERFTDIPMYRWYGARAYYNLAVERERIRMFIPPFARDEHALWPFPVEEHDGIRRMLFNWPQFLSIMVKLHTSNPAVSLLETPQIMFDHAADINRKLDAYWGTRDLNSCSAKELLAGNEATQAILTPIAGNVVLPFTVYLYVLPAALKMACEQWLDDKDGAIAGALLSGLSSKTGEENIAVWKLAQIIAKSTALRDIVLADLPPKTTLDQVVAHRDGAAFAAALQAFLKIYGQRGGAERDSYHKRYSHAPEKVFIPIRTMLREGEAANPESLEHKLADRMKATKEQCLKTLRSGPLGFIQAPLFSWLVEVTQQYAYYRDFERFYFDRNYARARDFLEHLGARFIAKGLIDDADDVFFLGREEIIEADEGRLDRHRIAPRVRGRRRVYERYSQKEPPKFLQGWRTFDDADLADDGNGLRGIGASTGKVTGRARVCRTLDEIGRIQKGDILVTVATDPGWTTLFSILGGVVVETGGVVAHAVLISREFGLPCVANVTQACNRIPDGATITVDGTNGRVIIHDDA